MSSAVWFSSAGTVSSPLGRRCRPEPSPECTSPRVGPRARRWTLPPSPAGTPEAAPHAAPQRFACVDHALLEVGQPRLRFFVLAGQLLDAGLKLLPGLDAALRFRVRLVGPLLEVGELSRPLDRRGRGPLG